MTEKIRREATEQIAGTVQKVDMAVKSAVVEIAEDRADTEKKTAEATVPRTAAGTTVAEATEHRSIAVKSAVHTRVRKEPSLPVMHRLENSRRMAVS